MGVTEIVAFIKALPALVSAIQDIHKTLIDLNLERKNEELDEFKASVYKELDGIILAKTDADRKSGIVALSKRIAGKRV